MLSLFQIFLFILNPTSVPNIHTICVCTHLSTHLLLYQMWGCDHNIGRCEFPEFTIKPAAPKAKLIYFILSAERPKCFGGFALPVPYSRQWQVHCGPSELYWFGGPRGMWHHYEDWPSRALAWGVTAWLKSQALAFRGPRALRYHGKIGSMLFAWLTSWCTHNPQIIRPGTRFTILHQSVYFQCFFPGKKGIGQKYKYGSPVLVRWSGSECIYITGPEIY